MESGRGVGSGLGLEGNGLINFQQAIAVIPSLAIHLDREANSQRSINAQTDLPPIISQTTEPFDVLLKNEVLRTYPEVSSEEFKVPARKNFTIPLVVVIPARKVFENNKNGILGGLLNSFLKKSIQVQFKGDIKYKVFGYSNVYPVDEIQEIKF